MNVFELYGSLGLKTSDFSRGLKEAQHDAEGAAGQLGSLIGSISGSASSALGEVSPAIGGAVSAISGAISIVKTADGVVTGLNDAIVKTTANIITSSFDFAKSIDENVMGVVDRARDVVVEAFGQMMNAGLDFLQSVMEEGMSFDTAMGQVSATLLRSREDFDNEIVSVNGFTGSLRDLAKELGATTKFSATQAGEGLNYMALAGYDAQKSAEMLPKVLDLAAAGAMDLGTASDMVTDAQTALGLSLDDTTVLIDQMAKTASSSNTSVSQLGDAILSIGATGRMLKGGYTELNTALGILADNGIKASEGGNGLRRILVRLTAPGQDAAAVMDKLGFSAYDAQDNIKALPEMFSDLNKAMEKLTPKERNAAISDIFGQYALAGANALLKTSAERWEELGAKIKDSEGAAKDMADIQLDTLPGQITILESAISGLKIELYDRLSPVLKDFVKQISEGLASVTEEISNGNFEAAFSRLGSTAVHLIEEGVDTVLGNASTINEFIDGIVIFVDEVGAALFKSGSKLLPQLLGHLLYFAQQIITNFSDFLSQEENIKTIEETVSHLFEQLETFFDNNHDSLYNIFSTLFDLGIQFIDDLFLLNRETVYSILSEKILEIIKDLPETIKEWLSSDGLTETIDNIFAFIGELTQALLDSSEEVVPQIVDFLVDIADKAVSGLAEFLSDTENQGKIRGTIQTVITDIKNFINEHSEDFGTITDTVVDILIGFLPQIFILKRKLAADLIWREWSRLFEPAGEALGEWFAETKELSSLAWQDIWGKIKGNYQIVVDYWSEKLLKIITWCTDAKDSIVDVFKSIDLKETGKNIIKGFWNGITSVKDWLIEKIGGFTDSVVDAFEDFFGIESPSKVMKREVGRYIALGIGEGMIEEMDSVSKDMEEAIPTSFDISPELVGGSTRAENDYAYGSIYMPINIEKFYANSEQDVKAFAKTLSVELRTQILRKNAAVAYA